MVFQTYFFMFLFLPQTKTEVINEATEYFLKPAESQQLHILYFQRLEKL